MLDVILSTDSGAANAVRSLYGLDSSDRLQAALKLLKDWIEKQPHFKKKDFSDEYLERRLLGSKGSVERTKARLDKYCTIRTLLPRFFDKTDAREFSDTLKCFKCMICPEYTKDYYRVMIVKAIKDVPITEANVLDFYKFGILAIEYVNRFDYFNGAIVVLDCIDISMTNLLSKMNIVDLNEILSIYVECLGLRIKGIHVLSKSKLVDTFIGLIKHAISKKLGDRVHAHNSVDDLLQYIPRYILPTNYGGKAISIESFVDIFMEGLSSEKYVNYLKSMEGACTDEKYRPIEKFNESYIGMAGSFRTLNVD